MSRQTPLMATCHVVDLNISASPKMEDAVEVKASGSFNGLDIDGQLLGIEGRIELKGENDTYYSVSMKVRAAFSFGDGWGDEDRQSYIMEEAPARVFDFARAYLAQVTSCCPYGSMQVPPIALNFEAEARE